MQSIRGAEEKKTFVSNFLLGTDTDCLVILSEDEVEDIAAADEAVRALVAPDFNCVLCFGAEAPIFIVPRDGVAVRSKILLLVELLPKGWDTRPNVVHFVAQAVSTMAAISEAGTGACAR
jgi:hypothetical protein